MAITTIIVVTTTTIIAATVFIDNQIVCIFYIAQCQCYYSKEAVSELDFKDSVVNFLQLKNQDQ